jgi:hypothetical protein
MPHKGAAPHTFNAMANTNTLQLNDQELKQATGGMIIPVNLGVTSDMLLRRCCSFGGYDQQYKGAR